MSWIDAGALVLVALAVADGAKSGFWWAVLESAVLVGSALISRGLRAAAEPYVFKIAALPPADLPWVTHAILFALSACSLFGLLLLVHPATRKWRFRHDRWAGGALGLLNGAACAVLVAALASGATDPGVESALRGSVTLRAAGAAAEGPGAALLPGHTAARAARLRGD